MQQATAPAPLRTGFDWSARRLVTSHSAPREALLLPDRALSGKRRVAIMGDYQMERRRTNPAYDETTTWHYNEDGTIDADQTGEWKLQSFDR